MKGTAIVVGGGIGGLAATRALLHAGWEVTLFEQAPDFREVGAGITLAPNAVRALDWLGLGTELRSRGMAHGAAGIRTASGRWLMRTSMEELKERFGVPAFALHRAHLHQMLTDAISAATLRTGYRVTWVGNEGGDKTTVAFDRPDGPGKASADLVVAADGIHSLLRTILFPEHPGPAYAGYITWRGIVPAETTSGIGLEAAVTETWGRGKRFGIVPLADGRVYWFATASFPAGSHTGDDLGDLAGRYEGWHAPIPQLLDPTPPETLLRHDIYHLQSPLPRYVAGRVALLGDAAHAITPDLGQGACLALEDAVTLGVMLGHGTDLQSALEAYDRVRRPRTQRLVRASGRVGRIAQWRNPLAAAARDLLARLIPPSAYLRSSSETFAWAPPDSCLEY